MNEMEKSEEIKGIMNSISRYIESHKEVAFVGSFCAFEGKDFDVCDEFICAYGLKETALVQLEELTNLVKSENKETVNI